MLLSNNNVLIYTLIFLLSFSIVYAAGGGGGGGGGSSCGLCFSNSRSSILMHFKEEESKKITLTNRGKFNIVINKIEDDNITIVFEEISNIIELRVGEKASVDLNNDGFYDLEIDYVKKVFSNAQIRLKDLRNVEPVEKIEKEVIEEQIGEIVDENEELIKVVEESTGLKCGNLPTLKERVECRLNLESEELEQELELQYLPEECRALSGNQRGLCIARYKSVQTCWKFSIGNKRISCVKREIKLGDLQEEKSNCNSKTGEEKSTCIRDLKYKVYNLIKWRFYDLEERAEDFMERGLIDLDSVVEFVSQLEENKKQFNEAISKEERKNTILNVRDEWKVFTQKVKENLKG